MTTERRCPHCGGLVGADAEWCGQCYARLDQPGGAGSQPAGTAQAPAAAQPPATADQGRPGSAPDAEALTTTAPPPRIAGGGRGRVRRSPQGLIWACPRCDLENPIETRICGRCGARFETLFAQPDQRPRVDPGRAVRLSLLFPGAGHISAGRTAEGVARAVIFGWTALTVVAILVMRGGFRPGPLLPLVLLYLAAAGGLYGITAVDAGRAAQGEPPLISSRMLLYGVGGLILLTVAIMFLLGMRSR
jgi:hypothetical protein